MWMAIAPQHSHINPVDTEHSVHHQWISSDGTRAAISIITIIGKLIFQERKDNS